MSGVLKPKQLESEEEEDEPVQYIEVTNKKEVKAILEAERKGQGIPLSQIYPPGEAKDSAPKEGSRREKKAFISDDREREYPTRRQELVQLESGSQGRVNDKSKMQENSKQEKVQYQEKSQKQRERRSRNEKEQAKSFKDEEKKEKIDTRQQQINQKGQEVQISLLQNHQYRVNEIFINERSAQHYVTVAKKLLENHEVISLFGYANMVEKAVLVAGLLGDSLKSLKQINIPQVVQVRSILHKKSMIKKRGAIRIELSLYHLDPKNVGYQEYKIQYQAKQQSSSKPNRGNGRREEKTSQGPNRGTTRSRRDEKESKRTQYQSKEEKDELLERQLR